MTNATVVKCDCDRCNCEISLENAIKKTTNIIVARLAPTDMLTIKAVKCQTAIAVS